MGSSVRIIKIVKDPFTKEESYTVEFECIADDSKELMSELTKTPLGIRAMELLNQGEFLPETKPKTEEELQIEAKAEEEALKVREEELREEGREQVREKYIEYIKKKRSPNKDEEADEQDVKEEEEKVQSNMDNPIEEYINNPSYFGIRGLLARTRRHENHE